MADDFEVRELVEQAGYEQTDEAHRKGLALVATYVKALDIEFPRGPHHKQVRIPAKHMPLLVATWEVSDALKISPARVLALRLKHRDMLLAYLQDQPLPESRSREEVLLLEIAQTLRRLRPELLKDIDPESVTPSTPNVEV